MIVLGLLICILMGLAVSLSIICMLQKAEIEDLKNYNRRISEMYDKESDRNAELAAKCFMEDVELLNRII